jgi:hypothetical protein
MTQWCGRMPRASHACVRHATPPGGQRHTGRAEQHRRTLLSSADASAALRMPLPSTGEFMKRTRMPSSSNSVATLRGRRLDGVQCNTERPVANATHKRRGLAPRLLLWARGFGILRAAGKRIRGRAEASRQSSGMRSLKAESRWAHEKRARVRAARTSATRPRMSFRSSMRSPLSWGSRAKGEEEAGVLATQVG